jgi:hypothetical protein
VTTLVNPTSEFVVGEIDVFVGSTRWQIHWTVEFDIVCDAMTPLSRQFRQKARHVHVNGGRRKDQVIGCAHDRSLPAIPLTSEKKKQREQPDNKMDQNFAYIGAGTL